MGQFKDSSEMTGKMSSGYGKTALVVGVAAPAMFAVTEMTGKAIIGGLDVIARRPANPYRFGAIVWGILLCLAMYSVVMGKHGQASAPLFLLAAIMFQTMWIIQSRISRLSKVIASEVHIQFGLLAGVLSIGFGAYMIYSHGSSLATAGWGDFVYWIALSVMWVIPVAMSRAALKVSIEYLYTEISDNTDAAKTREQMNIMTTEIEGLAKIKASSHFIGLIFSISFTAIYAFIAGQLPM